jgi:hypothetical protein
MHSMYYSNASMPDGAGRHTSMVERIERALLMLAYLIELDGDVHLPMYEKFEAELKLLKARQDVRARAQHLLASYREASELKAIC